MEHVPPPSGAARLGSVVPSMTIAVVLALVVVAVTMFLCPPLGIVPLFAVGIGLAAFLHSVAEARRLDRLPLERRLVAILERKERAVPRHDGRTPDYETVAVLQDEGGAREERAVADGVDVTPGELGVAFVRGGRLVAFTALVAAPSGQRAPP